MKTQKNLKTVYESRIKKALKKCDNEYLKKSFTFEKFKKHVADFTKSAKKRDFVVHCKVNKTGTIRRFDIRSISATYEPNLLLNFIYNDKISYEPVKVEGCGMDMLFHLFYTVCNTLELKNVSLENNYRFIFFN